MIFLLYFTLFTQINCHVEPIVLVHGGAEGLNKPFSTERLQIVKKAAMEGHKILVRGGSVLDAVEQAIKLLEDSEYFNAGVGSSLNYEGDVEMDASIMLGSNLSSGSVTGLKNVANPITVARLVMEQSPHFCLAGDGAKRFARDKGVPLVSSRSLITSQAKSDLNDFYQTLKTNPNYEAMGCGSVGAVAVDSLGRLAAATSSGGRIGKMAGRVGDASVIGASIFADDDVGAAVATGHGEAIARYVMAHAIIDTMKRGFEAGVATRNAVKGITEKFRKPTGAITLSRYGQVGISFTTEKMAWAYQLRKDVHFGLDDYDDHSETIKI